MINNSKMADKKFRILVVNDDGVTAPSLVAGGLTGYLVFKLIFSFYGNAIGLEPNTLIFLGMAATFACVMRAPVTTIFVIRKMCN